ncbi:alternate-type signal peptide domain-containing protein [Georgenia sp. EYE_87]|uniref:alternate-type signal peptide domain-containing protein n=1 Tax=Georgenia sp. EYE_87 TaxID=2853448 RepID=UPI00200542C3|nr:alternate-type signal peptide domain-containing protein [Georgenia sp. EYE_87]MCK6209886.1 alternate-type signal peptide domain-containing protein [Georgenia sp. EYE_87]
MNNKTKGALAGVAGVAILAGGTTFALWSDSDEVDGGVITAGNLDVKLTDHAWYDVSDDRIDEGHPISLSSFRIIPGDTIRGEFGVDLALEGDNMVAKLSMQRDGETTGNLFGDGTHDVKVTYQLFGPDGAVTAETPFGEETTVVFASADNSENVEALPTIPATFDEDGGEFTIEVTATFDEDTPDQVLTQATGDLAGVGVKLEQSRSTTGEGGF